jgi:hypothetical protein
MDLPLRFFLDGELYLLVERRDASTREPGFSEVGQWEAEKVLADALSQSGGEALLRAGLGGRETESEWDDRDGVSQRTRTRLDGALERLMLLRRRKPRYTLVLAKPEAVVDLNELAPDGDGSGNESTEDTWIEVLVLDDKDQPVANVEYEIELSDGKVQRGRTSEHGILRYEDLPSGSCKIRLLSVDGRGWDVA